MRNKPANYVSVIAQSLFRPITRLVEELDTIEVKEPNEVQTASTTNGYSIAVIVLSVLLLESILQRTQYIKGIQPAHKSVRKFFKDNFPQSGLTEQLMEVFAVRDAIVHNHIWEAEVGWDEDGTLQFLREPRLREGYGLGEFHRILDKKSRKTKKLGVNLFPPRIWHRDAAIVLQSVVSILRFLEEVDRRYVYFSEETVVFRGEFVRFVNLVERLGQTWIQGAKLDRVPTIRDSTLSL